MLLFILVLIFFYFRQGHSLALGALPKFMLAGKLRPVLGGLIQATQISEKEDKWAEARRDALKALTW